MSAFHKSYRSCFVPLCKNNSKSAPDKIFFCVPADKKIRKLWFDIVRRPDKPTNSNFFCCQDHFQIKEDMDNYVRFSLMGGHVKLKEHVVPHIFDCQPDRKRTGSQEIRPFSEKRQRKAHIDSILKEVQRNIENKKNISDGRMIEKPTEDIAQPQCSSNENFECADTRPHNAQIDLQPTKTYCHKGVQCGSVQKLSKRVGCNFINSTVENSSNTASSEHTASISEPPPHSQNIESLASPVQPTSGDTISTAVSSFQTTSSSDWKPTKSDEDAIEETDHQESQIKCVMMTNYFIQQNPKYFIGINSELYWVIETLQLHTSISTDNIKLTLMKIRLNDGFVRLGPQFGISSSQASRIFDKTTIEIAKLLKSFIYFSPKMVVKKLLPIAFRSNYSHVQSIIDCFEIEIEKPTDPLKQALTWSEYKKCNTIKYLVSATPDGMINFISTGYGGRISDTEIFDKCGIMEVLPENCSVMADRGFKQIATFLNKKKCTLVRPPSVSANSKLSKSEVLETKRIASLRIHIERGIRRLREYKMLEPHACVHHSLIPAMDSIVVIAAALCNLQTPIIKT